jgi:hypothetical protein
MIWLSLLFQLLMALFTTLCCGETTITANPFSIHIDRPWTACCAALIMFGFIIFINLAIPEILKK